MKTITEGFRYDNVPYAELPTEKKKIIDDLILGIIEAELDVTILSFTDQPFFNIRINTINEFDLEFNSTFPKDLAEKIVEIYIALKLFNRV